jgi:hypothetical protein
MVETIRFFGMHNLHGRMPKGVFSHAMRMARNRAVSPSDRADRQILLKTMRGEITALKGT